MKTFNSNGKLLLTGEYVVLDGAVALALPTNLGQRLEVRKKEGRGILWSSLDEKNKLWFKGEFEITTAKKVVCTGSPSEIGNRLASILQEANRANPEILESGFEVTTKLEFPRDWGLGSSSTLLNNIAQWFNLDPYKLSENTFGGSGYDIAAAGQKGPFLFQRGNQEVHVRPVLFDPPFRNDLFFVHLNRKQNSRHSIEHYRNQSQTHLVPIIARISSLSQKVISCASIEEFEDLLELHETLISKLINTPTIKSSFFADYPRSIKSLGGWGGDFVLAAGGEKEREYFRSKGYQTIVEYREMVPS